MDNGNFINPESMGMVDAPISFGIKTNIKTLLVTSGIVATDKDNNIVGISDIKKQTKQVMENLKAILEEAKMSFNDVIKVNAYLKNIEQLRDVIKIRSQYFVSNKPAATAVEVSQLANPDFLIEIEIIAVKK